MDTEVQYVSPTIAPSLASAYPPHVALDKLAVSPVSSESSPLPIAAEQPVLQGLDSQYGSKLFDDLVTSQNKRNSEKRRRGGMIISSVVHTAQGVRPTPSSAVAKSAKYDDSSNSVPQESQEDGIDQTDCEEGGEFEDSSGLSVALPQTKENETLRNQIHLRVGGGCTQKFMAGTGTTRTNGSSNDIGFKAEKTSAHIPEADLEEPSPTSKPTAIDISDHRLPRLKHTLFPKIISIQESNRISIRESVGRQCAACYESERLSRGSAQPVLAQPLGSIGSTPLSSYKRRERSLS
jgi:hypothetical protein